MTRIFLSLIAAAALVGLALAQQAPDAARIDAAIKSAFANAPTEWQPRLTPDTTMAECSATRNNPPKPLFETIAKREQATIIYPEDGKFLGEWKTGEALAQSGYGLRFTDYPARRENGGNCYACHQLTNQEVSYGTIGPSLLQYGKLKDFSAEANKAAYEKIYNPHAAFPCSLMPRFGTNKVLSIDQIKHLVALLMDPQSPVNK